MLLHLLFFTFSGPSDSKQACAAYRACADTIHERDKTRFTTYASFKRLDDKCYGAVSLVSINSYPGWYIKDVEPNTYWNHIANTIASGTINGTKDKPFMISETGAGGIYEWSDNTTAAKWTLACQTKVIADDVDVALSNENISGIALWHFTDFKVNDAYENNTQCDYLSDVYPPICGYINTNSKRPGGLNHKGSIDLWRRPKPAYSVVSTKYRNVTSQGKYHELISNSSSTTLQTATA